MPIPNVVKEEGMEEENVADDTAEENLDTEPIEEENPDINEEPGEEAAGEDNPEDAGKDEEAPEVDPRDEKINKLVEEIETLKQGLTKKEPEAPPKPREYSEEEKARIQEASGMDFRSVEFVDRMLQNAIEKIRGYVEGELGGFKKTSAIDKLSKMPGFEDAKKYETGVNEFLANFNPSVHSNEKILKMAITYAKGLGMDKTIRKVVTSKDKNKKIVGKSRPMGGVKSSKSSARLSDDEKAAAQAAGMSEEEYTKYKGPLRSIR